MIPNSKILNCAVDYSSKEEAARGFLGEVLIALEGSSIEYAIVGGWCPYLFNQGIIAHPGTYDVDVLIPPRLQPDDLKPVFDRLIDGGCFLPSKNFYQLFRILRVQGQNLAYHIDFLHPQFEDSDGLILGEFEFVEGKHIRSIPTAGMEFIFDQGERIKHDVKCSLPDGRAEIISGTFSSETGILNAKARSVHVRKRVRDAFDVFLIVHQSRDRSTLIARCKELVSQEEPTFCDSMDALAKVFREQHGVHNVVRVLEKFCNPNPFGDQAPAVVAKEMERFFSEIGVA